MRILKLLLLFVLVLPMSTAVAEILLPVVTVIDPIIDGNGWTVGGMNQGPQTTVRHTGSATATEGGALDCTYHFVGANGMNYIEFRKSVSIPIDARQLRFWVHADGSGHVLRVRVRDRSGQMLQYTVGNLNWQGWRQVTVNLEEPNGFWDGNNGHPSSTLDLDKHSHR